jgi:hypothetical protein
MHHKISELSERLFFLAVAVSNRCNPAGIRSRVLMISSSDLRAITRASKLDGTA